MGEDGHEVAAVYCIVCTSIPLASESSPPSHLCVTLLFFSMEICDDGEGLGPPVKTSDGQTDLL